MKKKQTKIKQIAFVLSSVLIFRKSQNENETAPPQRFDWQNH